MPQPFGSQDLDIFFQDGTAAVLADGSTLMGHFDVPEQLETFGAAHSIAGEISGKPTFRYATASAPDLSNGDLITIDDVVWKVRSTRKVGDGLESQAELAKGPVSNG